MDRRKEREMVREKKERKILPPEIWVLRSC